MADNGEKARSIFLHAIAKYQADQWPPYLDGACGAHIELRQEVERLLKAHLELGEISVTNPGSELAPGESADAPLEGGQEEKAVPKEPTPAGGSEPRQTWERIDPYIQGFERAWRSGTPPAIDDFLPKEGPDRLAVLQELIKIDMERRLKAGTPTPREEYAERFPELGPYLHSTHLHDAPRSQAEQVGTLVAGRYKLLEQIGEGGMGTVWVAEQTQPVRRKVALKLIKTGMDSKSVMSRFEAERQALALMDHPNIAKVLDGGTTESGRPFFAMEYVKGIALTKYCDDGRLSVAERLALFVPVCHAVQHAHQKGIIHRDLKPSNILVCLYDGRPVPKVIDFGLAKAMHQPLTEHTLHTAHGLMMGTPLYMSPEQAELNNLDVDTRTDIYALGVILYELLTGTTPLERKRLKEAAWQEMLRLIKEEEPPKPSARLSGSGSLPSLAAQRRLEPAKLTRLVRGELDWIVMKALEKDRSRRYETANGFGSDIQRYLADEPVEACPPSRGYRLRKFARRNRTALTMAATILLLALAGAAASTWQAIRATEAEAIAKDNEDLAKTNEHEAKKQQLEAFKQAKIAKANEDRASKTADEKDTALKDLQYNLALDRVLLAHTARTSRDARDLLEQVPAELRKWEWHYLHRQYDGGIFTLHGHTATVQSVAFSPDGTRLATGGWDQTAKIWDARTGTHLFELKGHTAPVLSVAFSADGTRLATGGGDGTAKVWDARTGTFLFELKGHSHNLEHLVNPFNQVYSVAFSPDGARLVTASNDNTVKVWDARTGASLSEFPLVLSTNRTVSVALSPDGTRVLAGSMDGYVKVWESHTGRQLVELKVRTRNRFGLAFSPDGTRLATCGDTHGPRIWDARTGTELLHLKGHTAHVHCVAFSPDGTRLATGSWDQTAKVWDAHTGAHLLDLKGHNLTVTSVAFSPDGMRVVTGGVDKTTKVWDVRTGTPVVELKGHSAPVWSAAFSPDGTRLATGGEDLRAKIWDARTGTALLDLKGHKKQVVCVAFSPDGTRLATGSWDYGAKIWDTRTGMELLHLKGHTSFVNDVAFSPDGKRLATASGDGTARVWDVHTGTELLSFKEHKANVHCTVFSPDGTCLATASADQTAKIWDARTGTFLRDFKGHVGWVMSVAFSPDGSRLVTASADQTAKVWDAHTGTFLRDFKGHTGWVASVAFSPDGTRVVTGSHDHTAKVWDYRTGTPLLDLEHIDVVYHVAFSADGTRIVTAGVDKMAKVWDTRSRMPSSDGALTTEEREYRLFWTRPRPDLHWDEHAKAIKAKNSFAADFHVDCLVSHHKQTIALNPRDTQSHADLGKVLLEKKDIEGAIAEFRRAIALDAKLIEAHKNLASALADKQDWDGARAVYRQILAFDPKDDEVRVILVLKGEYQPKDNLEQLELVRLCAFRRQYLAAARLYADAFALDPKLGSDSGGRHRYDAACYAALTASGQDKDAEAIDENERTRWRKQALGWLRANLEAYEKLLEGGKSQVRLMQVRLELGMVSVRLEDWQRDNDLVGIRDQYVIANLPAEERQQCQKLWAEVETLLVRFRLASARLHADAFARDPKLADDLDAAHRFHAARCAALAGNVKGLDENERTRWRKQALDWLRADLGAYEKLLESSKPQARSIVQQRLRHWRLDPALASIRDQAAIARLAAEERQACQKLWTDFEALRNRVDK
jgi:WD40 repeat protein/serine/threonine protein kinase